MATASVQLRSGSEQHAVKVMDVVKTYPGMPVNAVDGVSFEVANGEVFGLLGPNGAGKTTTVGVLTTLVRPTSGTGQIGGVDVVTDPVRARSRLAVVPQRNNLDRSLSIRQNLLFHAAYHGVPNRERSARADELLDQFGLADRADDKPDFFSGGQAQRIMIARALMHQPQVLFLDEPTTGLDPAARLFVWDRLRDLSHAGVTLFLTTHDMDEAAELTDRVGIMDHGKLLALDTPTALTHALPGRTTLELSVDGATEHLDDLVTALSDIRGVERVEQVPMGTAEGPQGLPSQMRAPSNGPSAGGDKLRIRLYVVGDAPLLIAPAASVLDAAGLTLTDVKLGSPSLEDVFIHMTGRRLR